MNERRAGLSKLYLSIAAAIFSSQLLVAQETTFEVTATAIPTQLLNVNYGRMPQGVAGLDLNICNTTQKKESLSSGEIFLAISKDHPSIRPIGGHLMLAAIVHNQNTSAKSWIRIGLLAVNVVSSVLGTTKSIRSTTASGISLGAIISDRLISTFSPVLTANQVEKFQLQVLPPALILDSGSCSEKTMFIVSSTAPKSKRPPVVENFTLRIAPQAAN